MGVVSAISCLAAVESRYSDGATTPSECLTMRRRPHHRHLEREEKGEEPRGD